jgi:3-methyladenine DNA glycosylase/8-oxoguanine DNA glycosylase
MRLTLPACLPFSLSAVARSHGWAQLAPFSWDESICELAYIVQLDSHQVVEIRVQEAPSGVSVLMDAGLKQAEQDEVTSKATWMLGLDWDLTGFYAVAQNEPKLVGIVERAQGRILRSATLFEDVVKTILTTNTTWAGTIRMVESLVALFGSSLPADPTRRAFPTPAQLALIDEETLRSSARLGYRAPYVRELARAVASGNLDLEALRTAKTPTSQLHKQLLAIRGVGGYAAAHLLMLLGHFDTIPIDSWALKLVSHEWHGGEPVGEAEVKSAFESWGEWKGLAYWFWDWSYLSET